MNIAEFLRANFIDTPTTLGLHTTTCPQCSHNRKEAHQKIKCLSVKIDDMGACSHCNHCGWSSGISNGKKFNAVFDYVDSDGALLWQKLRYVGEKKFTQRKPNGSGWDWTNVRKGQPSVLYRLPEVKAAIKDGRTIVVVEGEKDANNLWAIGIVATTSPDGAAEPGQRPKWTAEHSEQLRDADIVILSDHDTSGYAHQEATARLSYGVARRVRVLKLVDHWPECPDGGDISDWLKAGHGREDFDALLAKAMDYVPAEFHGQGSPEDGGHHATNNLLMTEAEFISNFTSPDYLIKHLLQRRYVYSMTAPTSSGKTAIVLRIAMHVLRGISLCGWKVKRGRVLYFAGENPPDVQARWIKLREEMNITEDLDIHWLYGTPPLTLTKMREMITKEAEKSGPFDLVIIDTSAAYFQGDDENNNVQAGAHARMIRSFVSLPGGPTIIVTCHPTKTPDMSNLLPRGGGAFVAEMDGNLVCLRQPMSNPIVELYWQGKFRGPDFAPLLFRLRQSSSEKLRDTDGDPVWTVTAEPITDEEKTREEDEDRVRQDQLLFAMLNQPGASLAALGDNLSWHKSMTARVMRALQSYKLVEKDRSNRYVLTANGKKAAEAIATKTTKRTPEQENLI